jgi:hypothetical protein
MELNELVSLSSNQKTVAWQKLSDTRAAVTATASGGG